jgi:hypothetical protein
MELYVKGKVQYGQLLVLTHFAIADVLVFSLKTSLPNEEVD